MSIHKEIILHCSATPPALDIGFEEVNRWHKARGWRMCGYHYIIRLDGEIERGRELNEQGAHTKGHNKAVGICYVGGLDENGKPKDTRTEKQQKALVKLIKSLALCLGKLEIHGHNEYSSKACPCFDVTKEYYLHYIANNEQRK